MNWWQMETKEAARRLETDEKQGLTSQMAAERLVQKGRNELAETDGKKSLFWRFLAQFDDFMILLLLGAAVVSVVISRLSGENDVLDAVMILGIVVLNAVLGLFQESKAEKALEALKKMAAPHARVIRDLSLIHICLPPALGLRNIYLLDSSRVLVRRLPRKL